MNRKQKKKSVVDPLGLEKDGDLELLKLYAARQHSGITDSERQEIEKKIEERINRTSKK